MTKSNSDKNYVYRVCFFFTSFANVNYVSLKAV